MAGARGAGAATAEDRRHMRRALALAQRGWGRVHPNPLVGAVVVRGGEVVGTGFHGEYGGPHAEVVALAAAGERARGATLYVTLEPCAHHGKTPPCTLAVFEAGIARVVYGAEDPSPRAQGGGAWLAARGVEVTAGVEREAVRRQNAAFFHAVERNRPYLALKLALSLDARLAAKPGTATAVTGAAARREAHRLRAGFDAIVVGSGTAASDDPLLTVRGDVEPIRPPMRVVLDSAAALAPSSRLVETAGEAPVLVLRAPDAPPERVARLEAAGVRTVAVERAVGGLDPGAVLDALREAGARSVLCEGGGRVAGAFLRADLVERLYLFYAPRFFGEAGVTAFPGGYPPAVAEGWGVTEVRTLGGDLLVAVDRERSRAAGP